MIWVNYNISLTWIKAILGWLLLLTMIPVREDSEVVIIYPDYMDMYKSYSVQILVYKFWSWFMVVMMIYGHYD